MTTCRLMKHGLQVAENGEANLPPGQKVRREETLSSLLPEAGSRSSLVSRSQVLCWTLFREQKQSQLLATASTAFFSREKRDENMTLLPGTTTLRREERERERETCCCRRHQHQTWRQREEEKRRSSQEPQKENRSPSISSSLCRHCLASGSFNPQDIYTSSLLH